MSNQFSARPDGVNFLIFNSAKGDGLTANVDPKVVAFGTYNSSLPAIPDGGFASLQLDSNGRLIIAPQSLGAGSSGSATGGTAGTVSSLAGGIYNFYLPILTPGQQAALQLDSSARLLVSALINTSLPPGTNTIGNVIPVVGTSGGATSYCLAASNATTNATVVKASPGTLYGIQAFNLAAYPVFIKLYNKATAPTVGSDIPYKVIMLPSNATAANGIGLVHSWATGVNFSAGISFAITKGQGNNDTTAVSAGDCTVNLDYN